MTFLTCAIGRWRLAWAALALATVASPAAAQSTAFVEAAGELSPVTIDTYGTTWQVARVSAGVQDDARFGLTAGVDRQRRGGLVDWSVHGTGYRHVGHWTLVGQAGYSPDPDFLYRYSVEGEIARRLGAGVVLHGAYRRLAFPVTDVHLLQPGVSYYFSRGHVHARGFLARNTSHDRRTGTVLVRGALDVSSRVQISGGTAVGTRIFDVAALPDARGDAWVVFGGVRVRVAPRVSVSMTAGGAHEDPLFSQRTIGLGLRWDLP